MPLTAILQTGESNCLIVDLMRSLLVYALLAGVTSAAATQPPPALTALVRDNAVIGTELIITELTAEQRAFIWKDTVRSPDGYLRVNMAADYLKLVTGFRSDVEQTRSRTGMARLRADYILPKGMVYAGSTPEDQYRTTLVFDDVAGGAVLTVWNFRAAGAKVTVIEEVLNQVIGGHRGTLALNVANGQKNALWKLAWSKDGISYELYVPDSLNPLGQPARRSAHIVKLGATLEKQVLIVQ